MLTSLAVSAFNRVLRSNPWATERLAAHAGKIARIECPPFGAGVKVQPGGELEAAREATAPDVVLRMTPGVVLRVLAHDGAVWNEIGVEGDSELATTLHQVWQELDWGIEEDLSQLFGDIAARRMATTARQVRATAAHAFGSAVRNVVEYWTEERPLAVLRREVEDYSREVDTLRDDVARLEKRIAALQATAAGRFGAEYGHNNTTTPPAAAGA